MKGEAARQILPLASLGQDDTVPALGQDDTVPAPAGDGKGIRSFDCAQDDKTAVRMTSAAGAQPKAVRRRSLRRRPWYCGDRSPQEQ